jgi:hypothetical protein
MASEAGRRGNHYALCRIFDSRGGTPKLLRTRECSQSSMSSRATILVDPERQPWSGSAAVSCDTHHPPGKDIRFLSVGSLSGRVQRRGRMRRPHAVVRPAPSSAGGLWRGAQSHADRHNFAKVCATPIGVPPLQHAAPGPRQARSRSRSAWPRVRHGRRTTPGSASRPR